jgi:S-layer homology domain
MNRVIRIFAATALLLVAAIFVWAGRDVAYGANNDTVTLTAPAPNTVVAESDDYATQVLNDPWDMNNIEDVDKPNNVVNYGVNNGVWAGTATTPASSNVFFQYQDIVNPQQTDGSFSYLGEKSGGNYPVDSNRFSRLWVRMNSQMSGQSIMWFFRHHDYAGSGNSNFIGVTPGWKIYSVDLRATDGGGSGTWTQNGPFEGLRFDLPWAGSSGNVVQLDWARLTPDTGQTVRIAWTAQGSGNVNLYLSYSATPTDDNELLIATVSATAGSYSWSTTGMAPGSYYIHAELNGATSSIGPLVVNTAPLVRIDAPSPLTGEEYAYAQKAASWDGNNPNQFEDVRNIANLTIAPENIHGVPTNGDPYLMWLSHDTTNPIDASKYYYFNVRFQLQPPASRPWSPNNFGTRILWASSNNTFSTSYVITGFYNRWIPAAFDLRNVPLAGGQTNDWSGTKTSFRFDPLEEDDSQQPPVLPAGFTISAAHLTSDPIAGRMGSAPGAAQGTFIRWTPLQGAGTLSLYRGTSTLIASNLPISDGQYYWDTSSVPAGSYSIYADVNDGTNTSRADALVTITVDPNQAATIFNDVPGNLWAVDYILRLAHDRIIGGTPQSDTTVLFKPNSTATRAQLSKMVVLAANWPLQNPPTPTFNDVQYGSTFYQYVETAAAHNVISGYACGGAGEPCPGRYFRPGFNVTRAQTAKMVTVSRGWAVVTPSNPTFADMPYNPSGDSLYAYVETSASKGIISGYPCGGAGEPCDSQNRPYFRPSNNVTRAQLSKMLALALDRTSK